MKTGSKCFVCYDGKYGRRVVGEVIATKQRKILVKFPEWASDDGAILQHWFRRKTRGAIFGGPRYYYEGYVPTKDSLMNKLFGAPGDYYMVFKFKAKDIKTTK